MNRPVLWHAARAMVLGATLIASAGVVGCKSQKEKAESQTAYQLAQLRTDLVRSPQMIDLTNQSLQAASSGQNPNRAADVQTLQARIDDLQALRDRLSREVIAAQADSNRFFTEWAREANKASHGERAEITDAMAARRANRDRALATLRSADRSYTQYVTLLENVERTLRADSTEAGVRAASPAVSNAITEGNKAKEYLLRVIEQVDAALAAAN